MRRSGPPKAKFDRLFGPADHADACTVGVPHPDTARARAIHAAEAVDFEAIGTARCVAGVDVSKNAPTHGVAVGVERDGVYVFDERVLATYMVRSSGERARPLGYSQGASTLRLPSGASDDGGAVP